MSCLRANVLLCDEDREPTEVLAAQLEERGHGVTVVRSCADAFAAACAYDFDALVIAPFLRDGSALVLPSALGIRRPALVVLVSRMAERLSRGVTRQIGFDAQLTKVVDVRRLDELLRASIAAVAAAALAANEAKIVVEAPPPVSEVGSRLPR